MGLGVWGFGVWGLGFMGFGVFRVLGGFGGFRVWGQMLNSKVVEPLLRSNLTAVRWLGPAVWELCGSGGIQGRAKKPEAGRLRVWVRV